MLTIQIWSPDTCGCVIHQAVDDANPGLPPVYQTYAQAVGVHAERLIARPGTTNPTAQPAAVV